jgi:PAS domain S-box-containing protein
MQFSGQQILESVPLGLVITDLNGQILTTNSSLRELLGYAENQLIGQGFSSLSVEENSFGDKAVLGDIAAGKMRKPYIDDFARSSG